MKINSFSKPIIKNLRAELDSVLAEFAKKYGIVASLGNARFTPNNVNWKFTLVCGGGDGDGEDAALSVEATQFKVHCRSYGMEPNDLGKTIFLRGTKVKIVGLNTRRHKYPVVCQHANGKRYVYSDAEVRAALLVQKVAEAGG